MARNGARLRAARPESRSPRLRVPPRAPREMLLLFAVERQRHAEARRLGRTWTLSCRAEGAQVVIPSGARKRPESEGIAIVPVEGSAALQPLYLTAARFLDSLRSLGMTRSARAPLERLLCACSSGLCVKLRRDCSVGACKQLRCETGFCRSARRAPMPAAFATAYGVERLTRHIRAVEDTDHTDVPPGGHVTTPAHSPSAR